MDYLYLKFRCAKVIIIGEIGCIMTVILAVSAMVFYFVPKSRKDTT